VLVAVGVPKGFGDQQIGLGYRHQQPIARVQRLVRKILLRNQSFELTLNLQMNVGGSHPVRPHGIRSRLHSSDPIGAIVVGLNSGEADEVWIQRRGVQKLMEGDYHVGQILDTLKELGIDDNTLVVFSSDNGPQGETAREMGNQATPDMGNSGPFRGELGEATEGSIRTAAIIRWPGKVRPGTTSYAMFSIMDFFPTFAHLIGGTTPIDRPIDGVDQTDVLFGNSTTGNRDSLLTFIGANLVAVRWKAWRMYFTDVQPTGIGPQRQPGLFSSSAPMAGYPKIYNIQMDPHEDLQVGALFGWTLGPMFEEVEKYLESVKKYPNPPAPNITSFTSPSRPGG
jgi:hypothetical protein